MTNAYFAGGCFWCITPVFNEKEGVFGVISGYSGGDEEAPSYEDVKHQRTSHRETIKIEYDPAKISYEELLEMFFANVDPLDDGGQYIDRGRSYTLAIYYQNADEEQTAKKALAELSEKLGRPACISLEPFVSFWDAEEYHQNYYLKNPEAFEKELVESGRKKV